MNDHPGNVAIYDQNEADRLREQIAATARLKLNQPTMLRWNLRVAADLPRAIRLIREASAVGVPLPAGLLARCDVAEQVYAVQYQDRLAELHKIAREATCDVLDHRGLGEFAAALESGDFARLLEGPQS